MNDNLLSLIQQALGGDFSKLVSQFLGEPQGSAQSALGLLLPAVLGGIAQKGATPQGATSLMSLINGANLDVGSLGNIEGLFGSGGAGANSLLKSGTASLVSGLFGNKGDALSSALASASGMKPGSATNLLAMVVPLILTFLKKFMGEKGLNANSLSTLLAGQGPYLKDSLDSRLTGALGYSSPGALLGSGSQPSVAARSAVAGAAAATAESKSGLMRWLPWLIGAAALLFLWNMLSGKATQSPVSTTASSAAVSTVLPAKVYFDVGAAAVGADGSSTIAAVARMINSEGLKVAVTGYTDRSGDLTMNEELAKNRSVAVVNALKAAGVPESSILMQPPVFVEAGAGDGTDAEARRVDISRQ